MNFCDQCSLAHPVPTCAQALQVGTVDDVLTSIRVRFTDLATTRVTVCEVDADELPQVVVPELPRFVPGHSTMVEVLLMKDENLGAPVEFEPWQQVGANFSPGVAVSCMVFESVKTFEPSGEILSGEFYLLLK